MLFSSCALAAPGCGSSTRSESPTAVSTPTPAPVPTPTPRLTISLDAPADTVQYSPLLARLVVPQAYEFTVTPLRVNEPYPAGFAHTIDVWLSLSSPVLAESSVGFAMAWLGGGRWTIDWYNPPDNWFYKRNQFDMPLGQPATIRITKHSGGIAELFVNGVSVHAIEASDALRYVRARVLGVAADITFIPAGIEGATIPSGEPQTRCLFCPPGR